MKTHAPYDLNVRTPDGEEKAKHRRLWLPADRDDVNFLHEAEAAIERYTRYRVGEVIDAQMFISTHGDEISLVPA